MLEDEKVPVSQLQPMPRAKAGRTSRCSRPLKSAAAEPQPLGAIKVETLSLTKHEGSKLSQVKPPARNLGETHDRTARQCPWTGDIFSTVHHGVRARHFSPP